MSRRRVSTSDADRWAEKLSARGVLERPVCRGKPCAAALGQLHLDDTAVVPRGLARDQALRLEALDDPRGPAGTAEKLLRDLVHPHGMTIRQVEPPEESALRSRAH